MINYDPPTSATFGDKLFVGSAWRGRILTSSDAIRWTEVFKGEFPVETVMFGNIG